MYPPYLFNYYADVTTKSFFLLQNGYFSLAMTIYYVVAEKTHVDIAVLSRAHHKLPAFVKKYLPEPNASAHEFEAAKLKFLKAYQEKILNPVYKDLEDRLPLLGDENKVLLSVVKCLSSLGEYSVEKKEFNFNRFSRTPTITGIIEPGE